VSAVSLFSAYSPAVLPAHCAQTDRGGPAKPGGGGPQVQDPGKVQEGDLVKVNFTASDDRGEIVRTTDAKVVNDPNLRKASGFIAPEDYAPEDVWVGHAASIPGLGEAVVGMRAGEKKRVVLQPDEAYGP